MNPKSPASLLALLGVAVLCVAAPVRALPGDPDEPAAGPHELRALERPEGTYWFDPDGPGPIQLFVGHYSADEGGAWLMVLNYVHSGRSNPALLPRSDGVPLLGTVDQLGASEAGSQYWGHATPAVLSAFNITELRFFGIMSTHNRRLHVSTTDSSIIDYATTGLGSMQNIATSFQALSGHSTNLPANANAFTADQGNYALTESPFRSEHYYKPPRGTGRWIRDYEWSVRGAGKLWTVDWYTQDTSDWDDFHSIHRVWIRTQVLCGNAVIEVGEECDDGNPWAGDGCSNYCTIERGFVCRGEPSSCKSSECGDGFVGPEEECDDGNEADDDGCDFSCIVENGYDCSAEPSACYSTCGDARVASDEPCDDGNKEGGDGCSPLCVLEHGFECTKDPSSCRSVCGDGLVARDEGCDDGNLAASDGCNAFCAVEEAFSCRGEPSLCEAVECDDPAFANTASCGRDVRDNRINGSGPCGLDPGRPSSPSSFLLIGLGLGLAGLVRRSS